MRIGLSTALSLFYLTAIFASGVGRAYAEIRPERVYVADDKKSKAYVRDGLIVGGDRNIDGVIVKNIRRSANKGFERIVIDLEANQNGEPAAIQRPPYYQLAVTPDERRLVVTLWGKPKLSFDSKKVLADFKKSSVIENIVLLPRLEDNSWTFVFELRRGFPVEVFELTKPVRLILDIQQKKS
jgi:hypothetical protein